MPTPLAVQVAFPTWGMPIPEPGLFDTAEHYRAFANQFPRSWIRHLSVAPTTGRVHLTRVPRIAESHITELSEALFAAGLLHEVQTFAVKDLECPRLQPEPTCTGGCTGCAITQDAVWEGNSHQLAVVVGMSAAAAGHVIPPNVMFSSDLKPGSVQTVSTDELSHKIRIALGTTPGFDQTAGIISRMFSLPGTDQKCLGSPESRVLPGKVALMIVANSVSLEELHEDFFIEPYSIDVHFCLKCRPELLPSEFAEWAASGLLVAPVQTVHEALALIGCRPSSNMPARQLQAYRVRPREEPEVLSRARLAYLRELQHEYALTHTPDSEKALRFFLRLCSREMDRSFELLGEAARCFAGHIAIVSRSKGARVMKIVAKSGDADRRMTLRYPGDVGVTARVLDSEEAQCVPDYVNDPAYAEVTALPSDVKQHYNPDGYASHMEFIRRIGSLIKIPIKSEGEVVAILSLHCDRTVDRFDTDLIRLLEKFTIEVVGPVYQCRYLFDGYIESPMTAQGQHVDLSDILTATYSLQPQLFDARERELAQQLATRALHVVDAFRTAVRLFALGRQYLTTAGWAGDTANVFPEWFRNPAHRHPLDKDSAARHALHSGRHYYIDENFDATVDEFHYFPIEPLDSRCSHASVILRHRGHPMGVLSVDWNERRYIKPHERRRLEVLAHQCAIEMKSALVDALSSRLRRKVTHPSEFLEAVGTMVGATWGALYLRDTESGRYVLKTSYGHSSKDALNIAGSYRLGEGWVGWVAANAKTLRVADRTDKKVLASLAVLDPPPKWAEGHTFDDDFAGESAAWMGVPLMARKEVFGVMRFAAENRSRTEGFSDYDQRSAEAAAAVLADHHSFKQDLRRRDIVLRCAEKLIARESPRSIAEAVHQAIGDGVGTATVGIRLLDWMQQIGKERIKALHRLYLSDPGLAPDLPVVRPLSAGGMSAHVIRTGRRVVVRENAVTRLQRYHIDVPTQRFVKTHGVHYCVQLANSEGQAIGTLHVARREDHSLSRSDMKLLDAVARLAGHAIERADECMRHRFELTVRAELMRLVPPRTDLAKGRRINPDLARSVLAALLYAANLDSECGTVWLPDNAGMYFTAVGNERNSILRTVVEQEFPSASIRVVSDPQNDTSLRIFDGPWIADLEGSDLKQRAAIPLVLEGHICVLFCIAAPAQTSLRLTLLEQLHAILSHLIATTIHV